jgi:phosphatidylglycerol:prolipoprotein diacylglycerol transferase
MLWLAHVGNAHRRVGLLSGTFLVGYAFARVVCESFRQPDAHIGFLWSGITMGQMLSVPLAAVGFWLIVHAKRSE